MEKPYAAFSPLPSRTVPRWWLLILACAGCVVWTHPAVAVDVTTDGSQADVQAKINAASVGDRVLIPAGTFTWGAGGTSVSVTKAVTLAGAGPAKTTINISPAAPRYGSGAISIYAAATVRDFTITQPGSATTTAFATGSGNGWRITNIVYNSAATVGYFVYAGSYGLIDKCIVNAGGGSDELVFSRGPADSWQTASSMGTASAVYIEDCTFNNPGYVCDFNSNARGVVRFCTINGQMKVDAHGLASNTPARGVRQMEVYANHWTFAAPAYFAAIELRGGTGMVFDNITDNPTSAWFFLTDYGYMAQWPNFGKAFQTPANYPITDQIGIGQDPKTAAGEPYYVWNNRKAGAAWPRTVKEVAAGAIALHGSKFTEADVIKPDRDFFWQGATFDGSSGIGRGTKAQMQALKPTKPGVGYWVTDEGTWNKSTPAPSGQLYTWTGSAWLLKYTPYTYPHPLRGATPPTSAASRPAAR
jgi:hypothetical protein